jgi:hypothetical protein
MSFDMIPATVPALSRKGKPKIIRDTVSLIHGEAIQPATVPPLSQKGKPKVIRDDAMQNHSKNSLVARSGFRAEDILCKSSHILESLSVQYFQKRIISCKKINGNKKSDVIFTFEDGTTTCAQLKNGTGGGRGWSFDRRSVDLMPTTDAGKELIQVVCLKMAGERKIVPKDENLVRTLIFGKEDNHTPEHFLHTELEDGQIIKMSACSSDDFIETLLKGSYEIFNAKKTCVHLTPIIYLQRKGGGIKDHSPNDIQAKLRCMPDCMQIISFT